MKLSKALFNKYNQQDWEKTINGLYKYLEGQFKLTPYLSQFEFYASNQLPPHIGASFDLIFESDFILGHPGVFKLKSGESLTALALRFSIRIKSASSYEQMTYKDEYLEDQIPGNISVIINYYLDHKDRLTRDIPPSKNVDRLLEELIIVLRNDIGFGGGDEVDEPDVPNVPSEQLEPSLQAKNKRETK